MSVYFTSDLHLGHRAVIDMANRPFSCIEEMNESLLRNINRRVTARDTLYILGDVSYRINKESAALLLSQIHCQDVHLIKGNHDKDWSNETVFQSVSDYKEIKLEKRKAILFHYPIRDWHGKHYGSIHLHGHIHSDPEYNLGNCEAGIYMWDVGVDANEYKPVRWEEILEYLGVNDG